MLCGDTLAVATQGRGRSPERPLPHLVFGFLPSIKEGCHLTRFLQVLAVIVGVVYLWWFHASLQPGILTKRPDVFNNRAVLVCVTVVAVVWALPIVGDWIDTWLQRSAQRRLHRG